MLIVLFQEITGIEITKLECGTFKFNFLTSTTWRRTVSLVLLFSMLNVYYVFKWKWNEEVSSSSVEFALEFHPKIDSFYRYSTTFDVDYNKVIYQCRRKVCRNADSPSMRTRMLTVKPAQAANMKYRRIPPYQSWTISPLRSTICQSTSDSSKIIKVQNNFSLLQQKTINS